MGLSDRVHSLTPLLSLCANYTCCVAGTTFQSWHDPREAPKRVTRSLPHRSQLLLPYLAPPHWLSMGRLTVCPGQPSDTDCPLLPVILCAVLCCLSCVSQTHHRLTSPLTRALLESSYHNRKNKPDPGQIRTTKLSTNMHKSPMRRTPQHRLAIGFRCSPGA